MLATHSVFTSTFFEQKHTSLLLIPDKFQAFTSSHISSLVWYFKYSIQYVKHVSASVFPVTLIIMQDTPSLQLHLKLRTAQSLWPLFPIRKRCVPRARLFWDLCGALSPRQCFSIMSLDFSQSSLENKGNVTPSTEFHAVPSWHVPSSMCPLISRLR